MALRLALIVLCLVGTATGSQKVRGCRRSGSGTGPQCGGFLCGVQWTNAVTNCSFVVLDNETEQTKTISLLDVCRDHRTHTARGVADAHPLTAYDNPTKSILYTTGDGDFLYQVTTYQGRASAAAALPANYDTLLGLVVANGMPSGEQWYIVASSQLLLVSHNATTPVLDLSALKLSPDARTTAHNTSAYIVDALTVHTIDLVASAVRSVPIADTRLAAALTLQYWMTNSSLVTILDRDVIQINPSTGASSTVMSLPAGQGSVGRATLFADMYFPVDDTQIYVTNLRAAVVESTAAWRGAFTEADPQFFF